MMSVRVHRGRKEVACPTFFVRSIADCAEWFAFYLEMLLNLHIHIIGLLPIAVTSVSAVFLSHNAHAMVE
jgi:hypothetical protein